MWYQTTDAPLRTSPNEFCMYPKSDFAEVTFDYHPNIGLTYDLGKFQMSISRVVCTLKYTGSAVATIVDSDIAQTLQIVEQFAIDGLDTPTTHRATPIEVSCDFTYSREPDSSLTTQRCTQTFTIKDCTPPMITPVELDGYCLFNQCAKTGSGLPDLFQACDGNRVTQDASGNTMFVSTASACCDSCTAPTSPFTTSCVPLQQFPTAGGNKFASIKRCEAVPKVAPGGLLMATDTAKRLAEIEPLQALAAASVVGVALVALVVVRCRHRAAAKAVVDTDAYYALLE